jgi:hypothetical protein
MLNVAPDAVLEASFHGLPTLAFAGRVESVLSVCVGFI